MILLIIVYNGQKYVMFLFLEDQNMDALCQNTKTKYKEISKALNNHIELQCAAVSR